MKRRWLQAARAVVKGAKLAAPASAAPVGGAEPETSEYEKRIQSERAAYQKCLNVHDLPEIALYWHHQHLMSKFSQFGISHPGEIFYLELLKRCEANTGFNLAVSVGSGNCDLEVGLGVFLRERGYTNFVIECLDLNPDMLQRGAALARDHGVANHIEVKACDFNAWLPERQYDVVIANQALHHVLQLEHLFDAIRQSLKDGGAFLASDMIGRNGHMRWPEALEIVHEFWRELPLSYRYNQQLQRYEELYENWDCSQHGFEGIRSQDILPLLLERFHFEMFLGFGNVIDPFVDRGFGHNFSPEREWDRSFIDRVHERDEALMQRGQIKPTHMVAIMHKEPVSHIRYLPPMTPRFAVRAI